MKNSETLDSKIKTTSLFLIKYRRNRGKIISNEGVTEMEIFVVSVRHGLVMQILGEMRKERIFHRVLIKQISNDDDLKVSQFVERHFNENCLDVSSRIETIVVNCHSTNKY